MTNWLIFDLTVMLTAYRNVPEFQKRLLDISSAFLDFLQTNNLLIDQRLATSFNDTQRMKIWANDLTELGQRLCIGKGNAFSRWLRSMSRIERQMDVKILDKELKKLSQSEP